MTVCFVFAMSAEAENILRKAIVLEDRLLGYTRLCRIELDGKEAFVCVTGIGKVLAGAAIAATIACHPEIDAFVNLGIGGSLDPNVAPLFSAVISNQLVQHDVDTIGLGDDPGYLSTPKITYIPANEPLTEKIAKTCEQLGVPYCFGTMASGDQFIVDEEVKGAIVSLFDALMIDMESAAMAEIAFGFGKPFASVRIVSDAVDHEKEYWENKLPACAKVCEIGVALLKNLD